MYVGQGCLRHLPASYGEVEGADYVVFLLGETSELDVGSQVVQPP